MITSVSKKIISVNELAMTVGECKARSLRVVQCHGVFDLLHPGHIKHFEAARRLGDVLVVTVTRDEFVNKGPGRPAFNQRLRAESIASLSAVDYVAINDWPTAVEAILAIRPDVYVKGADYADSSSDITGRIRDEAEAVRSIGGRIEFTDEESFSSTQLLNTHFSVYPAAADEFLRTFRQRYSSNDVITRLKALSGLNVLVVGEAIIDQYEYCAPLAKAPKDNYLVARGLEQESFAGGSLAVANHIAGFCRSVDLVACKGPEEEWDGFIRGQLRPNVRATILRDPKGQTIVKRRFIEPTFMRKLFEICYLHDTPVGGEVLARLVDVLDGLPDYDVVVVSDFGHGLVVRDVAVLLSDQARYLAINTQTNSQNLGYNLVTKYPKASYVCVDEPEIRLAASDRFSPLDQLVRGMAARLRTEQFSVTRGSRGAAAFSAASGYVEVPVLSDKVVDTVGAGDAYLAVTALCAAAGMPTDLLAFVGNVVGAQAVLIVGNRTPIDPLALFRSITAMLH